MARAGSVKGQALPILLIAGLLGLGILIFVFGNVSDRRLDNSPVGLGGLGPWLTAEGLDVRVSHPRLSPAVDSLGLRVMPLYDLDIHDYDLANVGAKTREERIALKTLRDIHADNYFTKISEIPSVVLLPKWTGAMMELGVAHEQSLIPAKDIQALLVQLQLERTEILRAGPVFLQESASRHGEVVLFQAQLFRRGTWPDACHETLSLTAGALMLNCMFEEADLPVWFVADPDLMNNHGLALGNNAGLAAGLVASLVPDDGPRTVYVDLSPDLLTSVDRQDERQDYQRGSTEFMRFFTYPFTLFWASLLITLAVLFWRGARRFGPVSGRETGPVAIARERSKQVSLAAKARLLRLSGHDGRLVADFVRDQMLDLIQRCLGPGASLRDTARLIAGLARRDAALSAEFDALAQRLMTDAPDMSPQDLARNLSHFQSLRQKVLETHGFT